VDENGEPLVVWHEAAESGFNVNPLETVGDRGEALKRYAMVHTENFKRWFGDWERIAELTINGPRVSVGEASAALEKLAGRNLVNLETGITAQINNDQRGKILSTVALSKSRDNGFTADQHNAVAARIESAWKHAVEMASAPDKKGGQHLIAVKRFASPVVIDGETAVAYLTANHPRATAIASTHWS